jgi:hypothetical protein
MPFKPTGIKFNIESAEPTKFTALNLKAQLNAIGFTCEHTNEPALENYIAEGMAKIPQGHSFLVALMSPKASVETRAASLAKIQGSPIKAASDIAFTDHTIKLKSYNGKIEEYYFERINGSYRFPKAADMPRILNTTAAASWELSYQKAEMLFTIAANDNFDKLRSDNFESFENRSVHEKLKNSIKKTDIDTIKELLAQLIVNTSARVLQGLTKSDVLPLLLNRFACIDTSGHTFTIADSIISIWANNPRPDGTVDALGAINSQWNITGSNSSGSKKSPSVHETVANTETRAVIYSEEDFINNDYKHVINKSS